MIESAPPIFLTIIIPAYNEERRLPPTLHKIAAFLRCQPYYTEVLVVENGSRDDTSGAAERFIAEQMKPDDPFCIVLTHSTPGKGAAVRHGMLMGQGKYLFICDADLAMPIEEIAKFLPPVLPHGAYDIAIASREAPGAERVGEPVYRHIMGRVFNFLVRVLAVPGIQDTQCGFKMFSRESAALTFGLQRLNGWSFDVEVLYIAGRHQLRLIEIPICWYYQTDSRVRPVHDTINMLHELVRIRRNGRQGLYDGGAPLAPSKVGATS